MAVLGEDGKGYELARKLESCGVWRWWLGESLYSNFAPSLSSSSSWDSFMSVDDSKSKSKSKSQIQLQLRVRALLFDKAASISSSSLSNLNPSYLQLHGDDVYFTLEDGVSQPQRDPPPSKIQSQKGRQEDFPETWYSQFIESYRAKKPYLVSRDIREPDRRNPTDMSNYLKLLERHKRRRVEFKEGEYGGFCDANSGDGNTCFFPETMFTMNCVPDCAIAPRTVVEGKPKVEFFGVLDTLPQVATKSSIMLERLGIRPEYLEQGPGKSCTKVGLDGNKNHVSEEEALQMSKKVVAHALKTVGFEGAFEIPIEVLSQFLSCHVSKLGRILKVLTDSYRKQCSAMELIKMFLQAAGNSNLAALADHVKDSRNVVQKSPQQSHNLQPQLPLPQQITLQHPQQIPRQMHPQMPQMVHPPNLTLHHQQHLERMRRRPASSPRPVMSMDKDRPMVEVKLENLSDLPMDKNTFSAINSRQAKMQWQQQQIAAIQRIMGPSANQMRQAASVQMPSMQSQNINAVRAPPVKVEGFQELMGGDSSMKQNSDESRLTSPSK